MRTFRPWIEGKHYAIRPSGCWEWLGVLGAESRVDKSAKIGYNRMVWFLTNVVQGIGLGLGFAAGGWLFGLLRRKQ